MPPKKDSGTDTTNAQGQETTRNTRALFIHELHAPVIMDGIIASATAQPTTAGVYILAKRVMKSSLRDLFLDEFSTSSSIFATVDSPKALVTVTFISPVRLMQPDMTFSPTPAVLGIDSPVSAAVSTVVEPSATMPSRGIFSPGFTTITSPGFTSFGSTLRISPFSSMLA